MLGANPPIALGGIRQAEPDDRVVVGAQLAGSGLPPRLEVAGGAFQREAGRHPRRLIGGGDNHRLENQPPHLVAVGFERLRLDQNALRRDLVGRIQRARDGIVRQRAFPQELGDAADVHDPEQVDAPRDALVALAEDSGLNRADRAVG